MYINSSKVSVIFTCVKPKLELFDVDEKSRNVHSPATSYCYDPDTQITYPSSLPGKFPDIESCHSKAEEIWPKEWHVPDDDIRFGILLSKIIQS